MSPVQSPATEDMLGSTQTETIWQPPSPGVVKVNSFGIVFPLEKMLGIGLIIRDSSGNMIVAGSKKIKGFTSFLYARAWSIKEALTFALKAGFRDVICESMAGRNPTSLYGELLISDFYWFKAQFTSLKLLLTPVSANKAALGLAEYAKQVDDYVVWVREAPEFISSVVEMESRGYTGSDPAPQSS